jgi:RNA polymerase sigma-70 factor (ECF subfamily)
LRQLTEERLRSLFALGLAGDEQAYRRFLSELTAFLRAFVRRRLARLPDQAEDLVQEILVAIHNQRHTYAPAQPLTPWVHAIARYKFIDLLRRRSRYDLLNDSIDDDAELFSTADAEAAEARFDVAKLLGALPARQRLPIWYVKIEGATVADTAERTGMSVSAVKVGIHRGLKALAATIRSTA